MTARRIVPIVVVLLMAYVIFSVVWTLTQPARVVSSTPTRTPLPTYTARATSMVLVASTPTTSPTVSPTATTTASSQPTPAPSATATATALFRQHVVQTGETMLGIAVRYQVDYQDLLDVNDISDVDLLYVGQVLTIPTGAPPLGTEERTHVVRSGETLLSVAVRYEVNYYTLLQINAISDPDLIYEGQVLIIPGG